ncbi:MAG: hypothetical protein Fur0041_20460 [Bacteroidia bacterium]
MKKHFILLTLSLLAVISGLAQTYTQTTMVTGLQYPVAFDIAPDGRFFSTQKGANALHAPGAIIKVHDATGSFISNFYDLSDSVNSDFERGLLGIALDPDFTNNHYVFVYYNHNYNNDERIRIVRFTEVNNQGTQPTIIFDLDVSESIAGNHVGGNLHFRPSEPNKIYFTIGDLAYQQGNPALNYAKDLDKPFGKILRINKDGSVPTDNPYYDDGNPLTGNCDLIWSYGHRNPFDFCFSPVSDTMYSSENGWTTWDEVNVIHRGANYGWAYCEGDFANGSTTVPCTTGVLPIETWGSPLPAVTGILYYSGQVMPEFDNHLLVADNDYGRVYDLTLGNAPDYDVVLSRVQWMDMTTSGGLTTLKQGADGCVYAMKGGYTTNGQIYRVCPQGLDVNEQNAGGLAIRNYPNPFSTTTTVEWNHAASGKVEIVLQDIFGRTIAVLVNSEMQQGKQQLTIDAQTLGLNSGNYLLTIRTESTAQTVLLTVSE